MSDAGLLYLLICKNTREAKLGNAILKVAELKVRILVCIF